jgi:hypothetical protein
LHYLRAELHRSLIFTGVLCRSYSRLNEAVVLPECVIGRNADLSRVVLDRGVKIPAGLVVGRDPELDASRFRRTESGVCLITQDMLDRAGLHLRMKVLSVASEVYPLIKTGGLADVAGALPLALAAHGVDMQVLLPGYRSVMAKLRDPVRLRGVRPSLRRQRRGHGLQAWTVSVSGA